MYGDRRRRGERILEHRHQMGRPVGMSLPVDPWDETAVAAVDDNIVHCDVDGCLRDRSRSALQARLRVLRSALLVHLSVGQKLLEQSHLSVWYRGDLILGHRGG